MSNSEKELNKATDKKAEGKEPKAADVSKDISKKAEAKQSDSNDLVAQALNKPSASASDEKKASPKMSTGAKEEAKVDTKEEAKGESKEDEQREQAKNSKRKGGGRFASKYRRKRNDEKSEQKLLEKVVFVNRCAKVVKGGRRFSFSALVVSGDQNGKVGFGFGKANEATDAIRKASKYSRERLLPIKREKETIPHQVNASYRGAKVILKPASEGTGIIAGGGVRAILEAAGIHNVLSKSLGSNNPINVVKATVTALQGLRTAAEIREIRGLES